ncbi:hypothetical protein MHSWG343_00150 [Candidatus Mycoplasma haematohominis]|uniref:Uncharacterized protein n=1 Tax=Candidatus Mycoplasma haematohominis TaxID=1494318 RepID=A0A478FPR6_9MOLU|nr:hypothetical protein MHSWG343_00150 [Candidatus Mycoplasma haemohominis]
MFGISNSNLGFFLLFCLSCTGSILLAKHLTSSGGSPQHRQITSKTSNITIKPYVPETKETDLVPSSQ